MFSLSALVGDDADIVHDTSFQLLLIANCLPPLGTALLSPMLESLIDPFGATSANIGLMISAFTAPPIVMIPIVGILADRFGRKPLLVFGLLLFGTAGTAIAFITDFQIVIGLRLLQGVGYAALFPILITSIGDLYSGTKEATAQGLRFTGSGTVQAVFPLISGVLVGIAWQYPFFIYTLALPVALILVLWFDEPTATDPANPDPTPDSTITQLRGLLGLLNHRLTLAFVLARGLPSFVWVAFLTYNSIIVVNLMDGTPAQAGLLAAAGSFSYALAATQVGRISAFFNSRIVPLIITNIALGGGFASILIIDNIYLAVIGISFSGAGLGITLSSYRSIINGLAPMSLRGGLVSLAEAYGRGLDTLTPILMGATIAYITPRYGFELALQTAGIGIGGIAMLGGIVFLLIAHTGTTRPDYPTT